MSGHPTRFVPGDGVAYVSSRTLLVTSAPNPRFAELVVSDADIVEILEAAGAADDLAVVRVEADAALVGVRGHAVVELDGDRPTCLVGGTDAGRDTDVHRLDGVGFVRLGVGESTDASGSTFVLMSGVVPATSLARSVELAATHPDPRDDPFDAMFGHTVARSVESAAVRDGAATSCPPVGVLLFSTGERVVVDKPVVLGRNPQPGDDDVAVAPKLVRVTGAGVSRRHAAITVDRWRAQIDDLGSANGTLVTLPGHPPRIVAPGCPVGLVAGARVDLGGEVSFVVEEVA